MNNSHTPQLTVRLTGAITHHNRMRHEQISRKLDLLCDCADCLAKDDSRLGQIIDGIARWNCEYQAAD